MTSTRPAAPVRLLQAFRDPSDGLTRGLAVALLVANVVIILTGGLVRLTASGLGCPTWPRCTEESFTSHPALGLHGAIEFGNRLLTYVLLAVAVATWVAVVRRRKQRRDPGGPLLVTLVVLGIPVQAVIGGISVLTDLNPWVVSLHLMVSAALVALSTALVRAVSARPAVDGTRLPRPLVLGTYAVVWVVLYLGTVVTGSGPHAGDVDAPRNDLDPATWSHVHAAAVYLLVALVVGLLVLARRAGATAQARSVGLLLGIVLAQGVVGLVQYWTDLPILLVLLHLLGASLVTWAATLLLLDALAAGRTTASPAGPGRDRVAQRL